MADRIAHQIIHRLAESSERTDTDREILRQLCKEFGRTLDVAADNGEGIVIRALNEEKGGRAESLPPSESNEIKKKLYEITRSIVYNQLIE
jgi:KaiC/GvpD/RAD55 family RecA-like ATPase